MMRLQYDLLSNTLMINEQGTRVHACYLGGVLLDFGPVILVLTAQSNRHGYNTE